MAFDIDETFSSNILRHEQKFDRLATHVVVINSMVVENKI